jgi:hypothetical protein
VRNAWYCFFGLTKAILETIGKEPEGTVATDAVEYRDGEEEGT